ncbi:MAG: lipopolysaccharide biosynthesis protein [Candidatus Korobacteraceae bacterium]
MTEAPQRSLTQRTATGVAWITSFQIARQVLQVISVSVLARRIPPSAYGLVGMAILVTNLLETIRDMGTGTALVRERDMSDELSSTAFWLNLMTGGVVTLLLVIASWPAARFFHEPMVAIILQFLSISFFMGALSTVPMALLSRAMEFRRLAFAQTLGAICATTSAIAIALAGGKLSALVAANLVANFVTMIGVWRFAPIRVMAVFRVPDARRILAFGMHLTGSHVMNYFSRNADNVLVGRFLGSTPLGYYQMGYMLMAYPIQSFGLMLNQVVYPALANFPEDHERFRGAYLRTIRLIGLVTIPVMFGLAVTAEPFVRVFLGPKWLPVAGLLLVFAPLGAFQTLYDPTLLIYNTQGRTDLLFRWQIFASISYVLSFIVGLRWGIMGVATCYAIVWSVLMFPALMIPFRLVGLTLKAYFESLWPSLWYGVVMVAVAGGWLHGLRRTGIQNAAVQLFSTAAVGAVVYAGLMLWRKPPVLGELAGTLEGSGRAPIRAVGQLLTKSAGMVPGIGSEKAASSQGV